MKMKGKGDKKKRSKNQEAREIHKKSNLGYKELKDNLLMIINNLESLVLRCSEKTELGSFLASVASEFCLEESEVKYEDTNSTSVITIEEELQALWYG